MDGHTVDIGDSFAIFATKSSHLSHEKHLSWKNVLKLQGQNCRKWPCPAVQWRVCGIDQRYAVPPGIHIPPSLILDIGDCSCRHQATNHRPGLRQFEPIRAGIGLLDWEYVRTSVKLGVKLISKLCSVKQLTIAYQPSLAMAGTTLVTSVINQLDREEIIRL